MAIMAMPGTRASSAYNTPPPIMARASNQDYQWHMLGIYLAVTATHLPNFMAAHISLPSKLHLKAWAELIQSVEDARIVEFLCFSFPVGYEGPVPTPVSSNYSSAINHTRDVDTYVVTEVKEGAMLCLFMPPSPVHTPVPGQ